jgi:hypothetical protein
LPGAAGRDYYLNTPVSLLRGLKIDQTYCLYKHLEGVPEVSDPRLNSVMKFDQYKYAVTGVPFRRKWDLRIRRDPAREMELFRTLFGDGARRPYICVHRKSSKCTFELALAKDWMENYRVVEVSEITDNPFDWLLTFERAEKLVMVDSCFANLVDQLDLGVEKYFIGPHPAEWTPVMGSRWNFSGRTTPL